MRKRCCKIFQKVKTDFQKIRFPESDFQTANLNNEKELRFLKFIESVEKLKIDESNEINDIYFSEFENLKTILEQEDIDCV